MTRPSLERRLLGALPLLGLAIATGIVAAMYARVFAGEPCGDDNTFHYAEVVRIADAVRAGDWDWWNPSTNAGFATGYYYQAIPAAVPGLLGAVFGHVLFWFQLGVFLPLVLVPAAGYRALRVLEADPWAALGGGVAIAFTVSNSKWGHGADGVFSVGLYTQAWALAAFPLAFAHGARWIVRRDHLGAAIGWGAFVGMTHPVAGVALGAALAPVAFTAAVAEILTRRGVSPYPAAPIVRHRHPAYDVFAPIGRLHILGALLLVASTASWLPTLVDYAGFGGFPHRLPDEAGPGFAKLGTWIAGGRFLDWHRRAILTALLVPALAIAIADPRARHLRMLWSSAIPLAFIVGVGRSLPRGEDDLFPAVRFMGALQIVLAMAAGAALLRGATLLVRLLDRERWGWIGQAAIGFALGVVAIGVIAPAVSYQKGRTRVSWDYDGVHRGELDELVPHLRAARPGRLQNRGVENHWGMMLPYVLADRPTLVAYGGAALQSSPNFVYLWSTPDPQRAAWIYDAPLVLLEKSRAAQIGGTLLHETASFQLRELPSPGLVGPVQVVGTLPPGRKAERAEALRWQASAQPMQNQVLAHAGSGGAGPVPDGDARHIVRGDSRIAAQLDARAPTTFAIRESWHPRWRATLDGRPVAIRRITPDMMAVDAPVGVHALVLTFERPWWAWATWLLAPLAVALGAWLARRRARA